MKSCYFIHTDNHCLLLGMCRPFHFNVINNIVGFETTIFFFYVSSFFSFLTCLLLLFIEFSFIFTTGSLARPSFLVVSLGLYYFFPLLITLYLQVMLYHIMYSIRTSQQNTSISPVLLLLLSFVLLLYVTSLTIYSFCLKRLF